MFVDQICGLCPLHDEQPSLQHVASSLAQPALNFLATLPKSQLEVDKQAH